MALLDITQPDLNTNKEWEFSVNGIYHSKNIFDWCFSKKLKEEKTEVYEDVVSGNIEEEKIKYILEVDEEIMFSSIEDDSKLENYVFSLDENSTNDNTEDSFNGDFTQGDLDKAVNEFEDELDKTDIDKINNLSICDDTVRFNELMLFIGEVIDVMPEETKDKFSKSEHYDSYMHFLKLLKK